MTESGIFLFAILKICFVDEKAETWRQLKVAKKC